MARLLFLTLVLIAYGSLYPWNFYPLPPGYHGLFSLGWPRHIWRALLSDIVLNVILYLPVGFFGFLALVRPLGGRGALLGATAIGVAATVSIETAQMFTRRSSNITDVASNSLGTLAGVGAAWLLCHGIRSAWVDRLKRSDVLILLFCWLAYQLLPLTPDFTRGAGVRFHLQWADQTGLAGFANLLRYLSEVLILARLIRVIFGARRGRWMLPLFLCVIPLKAMMVNRALTAAELVGSGLACLIAYLWELREGEPKRGYLRYLILTAVIVEGLAPFNFEGPAHFAWQPFLSSLTSDWTTGPAVLAEKAFRYGALVWLIGLGRWPLGVALLAGIEACQAFLPRSAEITDPLLAAIMAFAMWSFRDAFEKHAQNGLASGGQVR